MSEGSTRKARSRLARLANQQFGRVSRAQLREFGSNGTVASWIADGYLHRVLPHVYAVGHQARTAESDLAAALLYAGPGAALSHATAAWWLGLIEGRPRVIHVTTPRRCRSLAGMRVYDRRDRSRILHRGLTATTVAETLLDLAATVPRRTLRKALANAEYQRVLDLESIEAAIRTGGKGSKELRAALVVHQPSLAQTKSRLEALLVEICEEERIQLPEINVYIEGWQIDALWRQAGLAVELDGYGNHHTPAQLRRDRRKEMALRALGLTPVRYSEDQLNHEREAVVKELREATAPA